MLRVEVLCTAADHPVNRWLEEWRDRSVDKADISIKRAVRELEGGDILFLVSCHEIVGAADRGKFRHALVLHASALPYGRGMSPHIWQITEGRDRIVLTMLAAEDGLDTGDIWRQIEIPFDGTELYDEINAKIFDAEITLMDWALDNHATVVPRQQSGESSYYRRRKPEDSRIDPDRPLAEQFDLLRVADPDRYPAFFELRGRRYDIVLRKR